MTPADCIEKISKLLYAVLINVMSTIVRSILISSHKIRLITEKSRDDTMRPEEGRPFDDAIEQEEVGTRLMM